MVKKRVRAGQRLYWIASGDGKVRVGKVLWASRSCFAYQMIPKPFPGNPVVHQFSDLNKGRGIWTNRRACERHHALRVLSGDWGRSRSWRG